MCRVCVCWIFRIDPFATQEEERLQKSRTIAASAVMYTKQRGLLLEQETCPKRTVRSAIRHACSMLLLIVLLRALSLDGR